MTGILIVFLLLVIAELEHNHRQTRNQLNDIIIKLNEITCAQRAPVIVRPSQMQRQKK